MLVRSLLFRITLSACVHGLLSGCVSCYMYMTTAASWGRSGSGGRGESLKG